MGTYIALPPTGGGSRYYLDPVPNFAGLPASDTIGSVRLVSDEETFYYFDGTTWVPVQQQLADDAAVDSSSIDHTITDGVLTSALRITGTGPTAGNLGISLSILPSGLRGQLSHASVRALFSGSAPLIYNDATGDFSIPAATGASDGYLAAADFAIFAAKEPAIVPSDDTTYYRGDKTFATLEMGALVPSTAAAGLGEIGEILSSTVAVNTATGVGASGDWGSVTSLALPAGVWTLDGIVGFSYVNTSLVGALECAISVSATGDGVTDLDATVAPFLVAGTDAVLPCPVVTVTLAAPTALYLNSRMTYTGTTPEHRGRLTARRIR